MNTDWAVLFVTQRRAEGCCCCTSRINCSNSQTAERGRFVAGKLASCVMRNQLIYLSCLKAASENYDIFFVDGRGACVQHELSSNVMYLFTQGLLMDRSHRTLGFQIRKE